MVNLIWIYTYQIQTQHIFLSVDSGKTAVLCGTRSSLGVLDRDLGRSFAPLSSASDLRRYGANAFWDSLGANVTQARAGRRHEDTPVTAVGPQRAGTGHTSQGCNHVI